MDKLRTKMSRWKRSRIAAQTVFLLVFVWLFTRTGYRGEDAVAYPVKVFLELDPLILLTTWLSAHHVASGLFLALIVVALTVLFGRLFCGWVCPLGALNDLVGSLRRFKVPRETRLDRAGVRFKYYVLVAVLVAAALQYHIVGILDPISLTIRSFAVAVGPATDYLVHSAFDLAYRSNFGPLVAVSEPVREFLRAHVVSFERPSFVQGGFIGLLFVGILALNFVRKRFWCRFLCPLGALLGLLSRFSLLNHKLDLAACDDCKLCLATCAGGARPNAGDDWRGSECVMCMSCESTCPQHAVGWRFGRPQPRHRRTDLKRRYLLGAGAAGVATLAFFRVSPARARPNPALVRPPGSVEEEEFLRRCIKCGECMKVCITNGLQPTLLQAGFEGIWSPVLVSRIGYCEFNCTLCGQVCPTGAIERLLLAEKQKRKIGLAFIDKGRCLPYAFGIDCIVCEEHCPTSPKAIVFDRQEVADGEQTRELMLPRVLPDLCIGCGICENVCPVGEQAAVRVSSVGEDRSARNRILL